VNLAAVQLKIVVEAVESASAEVKLEAAASERVEAVVASSSASLLSFGVQRVDPTVKLLTFLCFQEYMVKKLDAF